MIDVTKRPAPAADLTVAGGCIVCSGNLEVRVSPAGAWAVCPRCRWLFKPQLALSPSGVQVQYEATLA